MKIYKVKKWHKNEPDSCIQSVKDMRVKIDESFLFFHGVTSFSNPGEVSFLFHTFRTASHQEKLLSNIANGKGKNCTLEEQYPWTPGHRR
jgi:hypothetical protein